LEQGEGGREQKLWRAGEERPLGELELDRVGKGVVAKLVADPGLTQKRQILHYHKGEVAGKLFPLVVVALGHILWVYQLDWRQNASS